VTYGLASQMVILGGLAADSDKEEAKLDHLISGGHEAEYFARAVRDQGGPGDLLENTDQHFHVAPVVKPVISESGGWVSEIRTRELGKVIMRLGGGRVSVEDTINPRVGLSDLCKVGDRVEAGGRICTVHAENKDDWHQAEARIKNAIDFRETECAPLKRIYEVIN